MSAAREQELSGVQLKDGEFVKMKFPPMRFGVVVFPGSNCDHDAWYAVSHNLGQQAEFHLARFAVRSAMSTR